jgi:hypothetical protein
VPERCFLLSHVQYVSFPSYVMRCGGLGVGVARPADHWNRTRGTSATRSMEEYSLLQTHLVGDYRFDYHRAVGSGAIGQFPA